jgi:ribose transport system ATP-binding protein
MADEDVFKKMAGRSVVETYPDRELSVQDSSPPVFAGCNLSAAGINDISFTIRKGEVLGLAALEGQGQSRLFNALVGLNPLKQGRLEVAGKPAVITSPRAARKAGIVLVPEDRKSEGIFNDLSTAANISIPIINRATAFGFIRSKGERDMVERGADRVGLNHQFLRRP